MIILVDAMGGDHAPDEIVKGCMDAINALDGFEVLLVGDSDRINKTLIDNKFNSPRLKVHHTSEVVTNDDAPTKAIKSKKDSSMVVGFNLLKEQKGDIFLSAGNTGALLAGGLFILGRIPGVDRPALSSIVPTAKGYTLLVDAGANTLCKPINYAQFGIMGYIYMKEVYGIENPRVGLINVGSEEKKGTETIRNAYTLLSESNINFIGNVEGRQIPLGGVDVAVCDGFVGNVLLKFLEGMEPFLFGMLKDVYKTNILTKLSFLVVKKGFTAIKKRLDYQELGGVPLLGVDGNVIKCHGSSKAKAIKSAIVKVAVNFAKSTVLSQVRDQFQNVEVEDIENGG